MILDTEPPIFAGSRDCGEFGRCYELELEAQIAIKLRTENEGGGIVVQGGAVILSLSKELVYPELANVAPVIVSAGTWDNGGVG